MSVFLIPPTQQSPRDAAVIRHSRPGRPSSWSEQQDALMRECYADYRSRRLLKKLAERLNISLACLYKRAERMGLTIKRVCATVAQAVAPEPAMALAS